MMLVPAQPHVRIPAPALHLRAPGLLVPGHRANWINGGRKHGGTRFRVRAYDPRSHDPSNPTHYVFRHYIDDPEDAEAFWRELIDEPSWRWPSWLPSPQEYPGLVYDFANVTFLTTTGTGTTWNVPADWNSSNNTVEGIGAGANGVAGGAYAKTTNVSLTPSGTTTYDIGAGHATTNTQFKDSSTLVAQCGRNGGNAGSSTGSTKFSGGRTGGTANSGGGGGAGPLGAGGNAGDSASIIADNGGGGGGGNGGGSAGATSTASTTGANGGNNNAGTGHGNGGTTGSNNATAGTNGGGGGAGGGQAQPGKAGGPGTEWDSSHGSGGAGGGGGWNSDFSVTGTSGAGALYGGSSGASGAGTLGTGAAGLIVVTYTPAVASSALFGHPIF